MNRMDYEGGKDQLKRRCTDNTVPQPRADEAAEIAGTLSDEDHAAIAELSQRLDGRAILTTITVGNVQRFRTDLSGVQAWRLLRVAELNADPSFGIIPQAMVMLGQHLAPQNREQHRATDLAVLFMLASAEVVEIRSDARCGVAVSAGVVIGPVG